MRVLGLKSLFIHISSAYVFGSDRKRFREDDEARPVNNYGISKLMGERLVEAEARAAGMRFFIIRTSWLYGRFRPTLVDSIVTKLREHKPFAVIDDHRGVVTSTKNLAWGVGELIKNKYASGTYHLFDKSNGGVTKYEIALEIAKTLGFDSRLLKRISWADILTVSYPTSAILVNTKFRAFPDWRTSLRAYLLEHYGKEK
jgi:dTDP-4-dehydrorhamnose reductase